MSTFNLKTKALVKALRGMDSTTKQPVRQLVCRAISVALSKRYGKSVAVCADCDVAMMYYRVAKVEGDCPPDGIAEITGSSWSMACCEKWITSWLMVCGTATASELADAIEKYRVHNAGADASRFYSAGRGPMESSAYDAAHPRTLNIGAKR